MAQQFQAGDVVVLKSGGPLMTVKTVATEECVCEWFIGGDKKHSLFQLTSLKSPGQSSELSKEEQQAFRTADERFNAERVNRSEGWMR